MSNAVASASKGSQKKGLAARFHAIQIFWVFVGGALFISGIIALYCIHKGGSVAWSTRFGVWVQVACRR